MSHGMENGQSQTHGSAVLMQNLTAQMRSTLVLHDTSACYQAADNMLSIEFIHAGQRVKISHNHAKLADLYKSNC